MLIDIINQKGERACGELNYNEKENLTEIEFTQKGIQKGSKVYKGNFENALFQLKREGYNYKKIKIGGKNDRR